MDVTLKDNGQLIKTKKKKKFKCNMGCKIGKKQKKTLKCIREEWIKLDASFKFHRKLNIN